MDRNVKKGLIASILGAIINLVLGIIKVCVGVIVNSVSIFFDGVNSFADVFGSSFGAIGIGVSNLKPNEEYPNGYGRMEYIMTFVISTITLIMGGMFIFYSVERIAFPLPVRFEWLYFGLLVVTLVVKIIQTVTYWLVHKKDGSDITKALYIDCILDIGITSSIIICYGLGVVVNTIIDAIVGLIIGIIILITSVKMVASAIKSTLGNNDDIDVDKLKQSLISEGIFTTITWTKINDFGKKNRELLIEGELTSDSKDKIKEFEKKQNIKIYVLRSR